MNAAAEPDPGQDREVLEFISGTGKVRLPGMLTYATHPDPRQQALHAACCRLEQKRLVVRREEGGGKVFWLPRRGGAMSEPICPTRAVDETWELHPFTALILSPAQSWGSVAQFWAYGNESRARDRAKLAAAAPDTTRALLNLLRAFEGVIRSEYETHGDRLPAERWPEVHAARAALRKAGVLP